jgi:phosphohistidine phosphatase
MKKLIFIRHARAEEQESGITDFERSLTLKGKMISHGMARRFREKENDPGLFISSPAFRALETALIFAGEAGIRPEDIKVDSNLYFKTDLRHFLEFLKTIPEETDTITLFGHNPSFTEIADRLSRDGCEFLTKTSIVCISFPVKSWSDLKAASGKQEYFLKPVKII